MKERNLALRAQARRARRANSAPRTSGQRRSPPGRERPVRPFCDDLRARGRRAALPAARRKPRIGGGGLCRTLDAAKTAVREARVRSRTRPDSGVRCRTRPDSGVRCRTRLDSAVARMPPRRHPPLSAFPRPPSDRSPRCSGPERDWRVPLLPSRDPRLRAAAAGDVGGARGGPGALGRAALHPVGARRSSNRWAAMKWSNSPLVNAWLAPRRGRLNAGLTSPRLVKGWSNAWTGQTPAESRQIRGKRRSGPVGPTPKAARAPPAVNLARAGRAPPAVNLARAGRL